MSVNDLIGFDWAKQNLVRNYPFVPTADRESTPPGYTLPQSMFIGASIAVPEENDVELDRFYVSSVSKQHETLTINVSYHARGGSPSLVGTGTVSAATDNMLGTMRLILADEWKTSCVLLTLGMVASGSALLDGYHAFDLAATQFAMDCVRPGVRAIDDIAITSDGNITNTITGDITLVGQNNINVRLDSVSDVESVIVFAVADVEEFNKACECAENAVNPIYSINGVPVAEDGNFQFIGEKCTDITADVGTVFFSSNCGDPCCDCEELDAVSAMVSDAIASINRAPPEIAQLESNIDDLAKSSAALAELERNNRGHDRDSDPITPPTQPPAPTTTAGPTTTTTQGPTTTTTLGPPTTQPPGPTTQGPTTTPAPTTTTTLPPTTTTTAAPTTTTAAPTTTTMPVEPEDIFNPARHLVAVVSTKILLYDKVVWGEPAIEFYTGGQTYADVVVDPPRSRIIALRDAAGFSYIDTFNYKGEITSTAATGKAFAQSYQLAVNTRNGTLAVGGQTSLALRTLGQSNFTSLPSLAGALNIDDITAIMDYFWDDHIIVSTFNAIYAIDPANVPSTREELDQVVGLPGLHLNPEVKSLTILSTGLDRRSTHYVVGRRDGSILANDTIEKSAYADVVDWTYAMPNNGKPSRELAITSSFGDMLYIGGSTYSNAPALTRTSLSSMRASSPPSYEIYPGAETPIIALATAAVDEASKHASLRGIRWRPYQFDEHYFLQPFLLNPIGSTLTDLSGRYVRTGFMFGTNFDLNVIKNEATGHVAHVYGTKLRYSSQPQLLPDGLYPQVEDVRPGYTGIWAIPGDEYAYVWWIQAQKIGTGLTPEQVEHVANWEPIVNYVRSTPLNRNEAPSNQVIFLPHIVQEDGSSVYEAVSELFGTLAFDYVRNVSNGTYAPMFRERTIQEVPQEPPGPGIFITDDARLDSAVVSPNYSNISDYRADGWIVNPSLIGQDRFDGGVLPTKQFIDDNGVIELLQDNYRVAEEYIDNKAPLADWSSNFVAHARRADGLIAPNIRQGDRSAVFMVDEITEHASGRVQLKLNPLVDLPFLSFRAGDSLMLDRDNTGVSNFSAMIDVALQPADPFSVVLRLNYADVASMSPKYATLIPGWGKSFSKLEGTGTWLETWRGDFRHPMYWETSFTILNELPTGSLAMVFNTNNNALAGAYQIPDLNAVGVTFRTESVQGVNLAGANYPRENLIAEVRQGTVNWTFSLFTPGSILCEMIVANRYDSPSTKFNMSHLKLWARVNPNTGDQSYGISDVTSINEASFETNGAISLGSIYGVNCDGISNISLDKQIVRVDHAQRQAGHSSFGHFINV